MSKQRAVIVPDGVVKWAAKPAAVQILGAFEKDGQKLPHSLTGKWDTALEAAMPDGTKQTIWRAHPLPKITSRYAGVLAADCNMVSGLIKGWHAA